MEVSFLKLFKRHDRHDADLNSINTKLDTLLAKVTQLNVTAESLDTDTALLQTEVANNTSVTGSAVTLLQGLSSQLAAALAAAAGAGATPAQLAAIVAVKDSLVKNDAALAAAVAANTPAAGVTSGA